MRHGTRQLSGKRARHGAGHRRVAGFYSAAWPDIAPPLTANWGLLEILGRGGCVIAPDRGYPAELIRDDVNGILLPDDIGRWLDTIRALRDDAARRARLGRAARVLGQAHTLQSVAPRYMTLFRQAMDNRARRLGAASKPCVDG